MSIIYVDPSGSNTSPYDTWAKARTTLPSSGVSSGDTVYISGGNVSQIYTLSSTWTPQGGSAGNWITYKVGQSSGHNGQVIIDGNSAVTNCINWPNYATLDGEYSGVVSIKVYNSTDHPIVAQGKIYFKLTYLYIISLSDNNIRMDNTTQYYEISYCRFEGAQDAVLFFGGGAESYLGLGANSIHHNYFQLPQADAATGMGTDGMQWPYSCDIYNNSFIGYQNSYTGGQHQDGVQTSSSQIRIYNNIFQDIGNYCTYYSPDHDVTDVYIYNNTFEFTNAKWTSGAQQEIVFGNDPGHTIYYTNMVIANNTGAKCPHTFINMSSSAECNYDSSCKVYNNIAYNCTDGNIIPSSVLGYDSATNVVTSTGGTNIFIDYKALGSGVSDFHLKSTDTILKDHGTSMATYFTTDKGEISRPQGSAWDIGAYEYNEGSEEDPWPIIDPTFRIYMKGHN